MSLDAKAKREPIGPPARSKPAEPAIAPGLYVVATPIGNADDITLRALHVLRSAAVVACEDTRVSAKLFARHGIATKRVAYQDHNAERMRPVLLRRLAAGEAVALISDAGTPLVSDPGFKLVREAVAQGIPVTALPGPSAPLAALVLSGLPCERFFFAGFLPPKSAARRAALAELRAIPATLLLFESGPRLADCLADMALELGARPAAVGRELTKLHEEVRRASLAELAEQYRASGPPKGEIVIVVGPPEARTDEPSAETLDAALAAALAELSVREAASSVAAALGLPRRMVYARALALAGRA